MNEPVTTPASSRGSVRQLRRVGRWVSRGLAPAVALLFVGLLAYGLTAQNPDTTIDDALAGGRAPIAPAFRLAVLQPGSLGALLQRGLTEVFHRPSVTLADLRGTPIVLNIWASWCVPCQLEAPTLERAWREQARPHGVLFLGLDMQDDTLDAGTFMRHYGVDYPNIRDPSNDVARSYGATGVPETFFITTQGRVVGHIPGVSTAQQLIAGIAAARSGRVQGAGRGGARRSFR